MTFQRFSGDGQAVRQPFVLRILRHMQEQLDDRGAAIDLLGFELVDLVIAALPVALAAIAFDPLDQHTAVP